MFVKGNKGLEPVEGLMEVGVQDQFLDLVVLGLVEIIGLMVGLLAGLMVDLGLMEDLGLLFKGQEPEDAEAKDESNGKMNILM